MKGNREKRIIMGIAFTTLIACNTKQAEPVTIDKDAIKAEIQAKENEFADLYNSGEIKRIGYYADDAVTFFQNRKPITSLEERAEFLKSDIDSNYNSITFTTLEIFPSSDGNMVLEVGQYKVMDTLKTVVNSGNYMSLFEKRNGKYVCLRDMSASDMPNE